jgi:hypothetical protein
MCGSSHLCIISEVSRSKGASELLTQKRSPPLRASFNGRPPQDRYAAKIEHQMDQCRYDKAKREASP